MSNSTSSGTGKAAHHLVAGIFGGFTSTGGFAISIFLVYFPILKVTSRILVALYPLELIKTRMQVTGRYGIGEYGSLYASFRTVVSREGFRGLYQGVVPAIIGSCGAWGGYFYFYCISFVTSLRCLIARC